MTSDRRDVHNSDVPIPCRACEARHKGICGALSPEQLLELSKHTSRAKVSASQELLSEDEPIERYANVLSGVVKLSKMLEDGRQQVVGLQFAPDFLGRPYEHRSNVTAVAATDAEMCFFSKSVLDRIASEAPGIGVRFYKQTRRELDEAQEWMLALGRKSAFEKVASFFQFIAMHIDPEREETVNRVSFDLPLTRAEIADFLGLTIETVSRQITQLRKQQLIEIVENRHVTIPDLARLQDACGS